MADVNDKIMYRPGEVAHLTGLGLRTVFALLAAGEIASVKVGSARLITRQALDDFVRHLEVEAAGS